MRLFKPSGATTFHVEFTTENGTLKTVDTECATKAEAKEVVSKAKIEDLEKAGKAHRLTAEVVTLITANRSISVSEAINEWAEWMKVAVRAPKTRENNLISAKQWAREMGIESKSIGAIGEDEVHRWINRADTFTKRGTRLMKLSAIRNLFRFCTIKRYTLTDPSQLVSVDHKIMTHSQKETKHKKVFTDDEIDFLIAKCDGAEPPSLSTGFFKSAIIIGRDLGLRLVDICNLEWSQFDFVRKTVTVWMEKTGNRIEVPMSTRVLRLVAAMEKRDDQYLFPAERSIINDTNSRAKLSVAFGRFFERNGFEGYSFHSIRGSLATTMANQGKTMDEIAEALGHKGRGATPAYVRKENAAVVNKR